MGLMRQVCVSGIGVVLFLEHVDGKVHAFDERVCVSGGLLVPVG